MDGDHEVDHGSLDAGLAQWDDIGLPPNMVVEVRDLWKHVTLEKRFVNELRAPPCLQDVLVDASYTIKRG
ncbi:unnamed protein product [Musa acuminata subsp. burmannicoides]